MEHIASKKIPANPKCQKCLESGHWTFECQGKRKYLHRASRTRILKKCIRSREINIPNETKKKEIININMITGDTSDNEDTSGSSSSSSSESDTSSSESDSSSSSSSSSLSSSSSNSQSSSMSSSSKQNKKKKKLQH